MTNKGFTDIPREKLFSCSVPLTDAHKYYIVDGVLERAEANDTAEKVCESIGAGNIHIYPVDQALMQFIFIRCKTDDAIYSESMAAKSGTYSNIVLCQHTTGDNNYSTEEKIAIKVEQDAQLNLLVMQNENAVSEHKTYFEIEVCAGGKLVLNIMTLHGGLVTNTIETRITGEHASVEHNGLYLADGRQRVNTKINLTHCVPNCTSSQLFKGILNGEAHTNFDGNIIVAKGAQKTEAYQANNNLLISDHSKATSKPQLIIYADDVKCSHGATIGSIGTQELFYMRSRGISEKEAKLLQQQAFAGAVLEKVGNKELRERIAELIERRLRGELTHCTDCAYNCC